MSNIPTARGSGSDAITLTWPALPEARQYKIYRDGEFAGLTSNNTYTDSGLKANKEYSYRVTSINGAGAESEPSPALSQPAVKARTYAAYPTAVEVTAKTRTSLTLRIVPSQFLEEAAKYSVIIKNKATGTTAKTFSYSPETIYEIPGLNQSTEYEVWAVVRNKDNHTLEEKSFLDSVFTNRGLVGAITNDAPATRSEQPGFKDDFVINMKVHDPDGDAVTATATIGGITATKTIMAPAAEPGAANLQLSWDVWSLPEGVYSNIPVSLRDTRDSQVTLNFAGPLTISKTPSPLTVTGRQYLLFLSMNHQGCKLKLKVISRSA